MDEAFLDKIRFYSEKRHMSLNAYIESVLRTEVERIEELPHLDPCTEISPEILAFSGILDHRRRIQFQRKEGIADSHELPQKREA